MESVTNARLGGLRASSPTGYKLKDVAGYLDRDLATVSSLIFALRRALPKMRTCESRPSDCGKIVQNRKSDPDPSNFYAEVKPIKIAGSPREIKAERWDHASVHEFRGTYGDYLLKSPKCSRN